MAVISVEPSSDRTVQVTVEGDGATTRHLVTVDVSRDEVQDLDLVKASFRFLLDREPAESILSRFDLSVIEQYFPEWPDRIGDYL